MKKLIPILWEWSPSCFLPWWPESRSKWSLKKIFFFSNFKVHTKKKLVLFPWRWFPGTPVIGDLHIQIRIIMKNNLFVETPRTFNYIYKKKNWIDSSEMIPKHLCHRLPGCPGQKLMDYCIVIWPEDLCKISDL